MLKTTTTSRPTRGIDIERPADRRRVKQGRAASNDPSGRQDELALVASKLAAKHGRARRSLIRDHGHCPAAVVVAVGVAEEAILAVTGVAGVDDGGVGLERE